MQANNSPSPLWRSGDKTKKRIHKHKNYAAPCTPSGVRRLAILRRYMMLLGTDTHVPLRTTGSVYSRRNKWILRECTRHLSYVAHYATHLSHLVLHFDYRNQKWMSDKPNSPSCWRKVINRGGGTGPASPAMAGPTFAAPMSVFFWRF